VSDVCPVAFSALLALKLAGVIGWSWWLVTLPMWGQLFIPILWLAALLGGGPGKLSSVAEDTTVVTVRSPYLGVEDEHGVTIAPLMDGPHA
jgi:hypothetical protein